MKILIVALILGIAHADPEKELWPGKPFKHVVAYCYYSDHDKRGSAIAFDDGSLNSGIIRATTVRLDDAQTLKLRKILSTNSDTRPRGKGLCYDPHHAFIFYDENWKVTASMEICFLCIDYKSRPKGVSEAIDVAALKTFCSELGLPMFDDPTRYKQLFYQEMPPKPKK